MKIVASCWIDAQEGFLSGLACKRGAHRDGLEAAGHGGEVGGCRSLGIGCARREAVCGRDAADRQRR